MSENNLDLFGQLAHLQWLLHRYHQQNHRMHGPMGDPHRGQGRILALLKMQPEISQKDLSYLLDMRPQSLGELLTKLERGGYITRTPSESDRRSMNIHLTEEGTKATEQQTDFDTLFDCLNEEELALLSEYLNRLIASLEQRLGDDQQTDDNRVEPDFPWQGNYHTRPSFDGPFGHHHGMEHGRPAFGWHPGRRFDRGYDMRQGQENYPPAPPRQEDNRNKDKDE